MVLVGKKDEFGLELFHNLGYYGLGIFNEKRTEVQARASR